MFDAGAVIEMAPRVFVRTQRETEKPPRLVGEGEGEKVEKMVVAVKAEVARLLEGRRDEEIQKAHIDDVYRNALAIAKPQTGEERAMVELFAWAHDIGKWLPADDPVIEAGNEPELQQKLGFGGFDGVIYKRFVEARQKYKDKPGYEVERDIAHHLIGAAWFLKKAEAMGYGQSVFAARMVDAIVDHQFGGYYTVVARDLGYTSEEVRGISKSIALNNRFAREMRVADLTAMAQVGRVEGEEVKIGGFLKLVLINSDIFPDGPAKKWLNSSYVSVIEGETEAGISPAGIDYYRREKERVDRFKQWVGERLNGLGRLGYQERVTRLKELVREFASQEKSGAVVKL